MIAGVWMFCAHGEEIIRFFLVLQWDEVSEEARRRDGAR
jgi:hypothetical protein